jgi:hypothetical protein
LILERLLPGETVTEKLGPFYRAKMEEWGRISEGWSALPLGISAEARISTLPKQYSAGPTSSSETLYTLGSMEGYFVYSANLINQ